MFSYIKALIRRRQGSIVAIGGTFDHVHILVKIRPTNFLPYFLRDIKAVSSKFINKINDERFLFRWQRGYGAYVVGPQYIDVITNYINNQEEHHKTMDIKDEVELMMGLGHTPWQEKPAQPERATRPKGRIPQGFIP